MAPRCRDVTRSPARNQCQSRASFVTQSRSSESHVTIDASDAPALFTVGTLDPLLDDSVQMAARWQAAGNSRELRIWPDGIHGFNAFPTGLARLANDVQFSFLDEIYAAVR
jgi:acetyl esterase/lipase